MKSLGTVLGVAPYTVLILDGEYKPHRVLPNPRTLLLIKCCSTGNYLGDSGVTVLSDALKKNTTLTRLRLQSEWTGMCPEQASQINQQVCGQKMESERSGQLHCAKH